MKHRQRMLVMAGVLFVGVGFTARVAENSTLGVTAAATVVEPAFRVSRLRDEISLHGHTMSVSQELKLLEAAASTFPEIRIRSAFEPLGLVPAHWENTAIQALHTLAAAESGTATLGSDQVTFSIVATDDGEWAVRLVSLRTNLADTVDVVDQSISVASTDVGGLCRNAFAGFSIGAINFEESTARFRPSAYPRLQRLAALADACRDSTVHITGHADSSGNERWNLALSLRRAEAVSGYLVSKGVAADRIQPRGAGSAVPVASNATRYGRSLNRRIEVEFSPR